MIASSTVVLMIVFCVPSASVDAVGM